MPLWHLELPYPIPVRATLAEVITEMRRKSRRPNKVTSTGRGVIAPTSTQLAWFPRHSRSLFVLESDSSILWKTRRSNHHKVLCHSHHNTVCRFLAYKAQTYFMSGQCYWMAQFFHSLVHCLIGTKRSYLWTDAESMTSNFWATFLSKRSVALPRITNPFSQRAMGNEQV